MFVFEQRIFRQDLIWSDQSQRSTDSELINHVWAMKQKINNLILNKPITNTECIWMDWTAKFDGIWDHISSDRPFSMLIAYVHIICKDMKLPQIKWGCKFHQRSFVCIGPWIHAWNSHRHAPTHLWVSERSYIFCIYFIILSIFLDIYIYIYYVLHFFPQLLCFAIYYRLLFLKINHFSI